MARRGRPRKSGPRLKNGRLRYISPNDRGSELALLHRAADLGGADPTDPAAGTPIGKLWLRGDLADPGLDPGPAKEQGELRYQAALIFERVCNLAGLAMAGRPNPATLSCLASLLADTSGSFDGLADDDYATRMRRCEKQAREAYGAVSIHGSRPRHVLDNIVRYQREPRFMDTSHRRQPEAWDADARDLAALRLALQELAHLWRLDR